MTESNQVNGGCFIRIQSSGIVDAKNGPLSCRERGEFEEPKVSEKVFGAKKSPNYEKPSNISLPNSTKSLLSKKGKGEDRERQVKSDEVQAGKSNDCAVYSENEKVTTHGLSINYHQPCSIGKTVSILQNEAEKFQSEVCDPNLNVLEANGSSSSTDLSIDDSKDEDFVPMPACDISYTAGSRNFRLRGAKTPISRKGNIFKVKNDGHKVDRGRREFKRSPFIGMRKQRTNSILEALVDILPEKSVCDDILLNIGARFHSLDEESTNTFPNGVGDILGGLENEQDVPEPTDHVDFK
ncbi:hypothetical protein CLIB1444_12S01332 [[Candida] jaroonii]|uniref:Uncharacterized protein n=1 Tax=[Candida] jaroonii TaxID=467808 RepID=A0ACA9YD41_9ASCO|nr:hypothetical protein CLIB1444_12S01332 [[Candida] jaroonii]